MARHAPWLAVAAMGLASSTQSLVHAEDLGFLAPGRVKAQWIGWDDGKPSAHSPTFNPACRKA